MEAKLFQQAFWQTVQDAAVTFFKSVLPFGFAILIVGLVNELVLKAVYVPTVTLVSALAIAAWVFLSVQMLRTGYRSLAPLESKAWIGGLAILATLPLVLVVSAFFFRGAKADAVVQGFLADPWNAIWGSYAFVGLFGGIQLFIGGIARSLAKAK